MNSTVMHFLSIFFRSANAVNKAAEKNSAWNENENNYHCI